MLDVLASLVDRLDRLFGDVDEQQGNAFPIDYGLVDHQWWIQGVTAKIGELARNHLRFLWGDADNLGRGTINSEHQKPTAGLVGKCGQVFSETLLLG